MKVKAAIALEKAKPLIVDYVDLEGPKQGEVLVEIKSNYNFPITLTASMTRSLTEAEFQSIGQQKEWCVLPVKPMGATIRMTKARRILIRNTAEVHNPFKMSKKDLDKRSINQKIGIKKRFPKLGDDIIQ